MRRVSLGILTIIVASAVHADTVVLSPTKDNSIYADNVAASNGAGEAIFAGANGSAFARRAFIAFDVAGAIPVGAAIDSVVLELMMSRTLSTSGPQPVALHRVLADWGEGASDALGNEGGGAPALPGDVTWTYRFYDTDLWATPGGEFDSVASAVRVVNDIGPYAWKSPAMRDDVQAWLDTPGANFGWVLVGHEGTPFTAKRFGSDEDTTLTNRPRLVVHYHGPATAIDDRTPAFGRLLPATPNPFSRTTSLRFELQESQRATVAVYDVHGREVRRVTAGEFARGVHEAFWNGSDASGAAVSSGVYFVRLEIGGRTMDVQRVVLVR